MTSLKHQEGWLTKIFFISIFFLIAFFILDCKFAILPINGFYLFLYLIVALSISVWLTSRLLQSLLQETKPIEYNTLKGKFFNKVHNFINKCISSSPNNSDICDSKQKEESKEEVVELAEGQADNETSKMLQCDVKVCNESNVYKPNFKLKVCTESQSLNNVYSIDDRISDFVKDIKNRFLMNWYQHISKDECFILESEKLLEEIVRRFLQVVVQIDHKKLTHSILVILLKHLKEFRKTIKRSEKNGMSIEECFRYSHVASKSDKAFEYYVYQLTTKILKQFITSELWNSLLWRTLVSILSKKLTTNILYHVSQPGFVNYKIVYNCSSADIMKELEGKSYISLSDIDLKRTKVLLPRELQQRKDELKCDAPDGGSTPKLSPKRGLLAGPGDDERHEDDGSEVNRNKLGVIPEGSECNGNDDSLKQNNGTPSTRTVSEPVKIYNSSSEKTWRNSSDLECISLGEDLLALQESVDPDSQIQCLIEKKLWKDNSDSTESEDKEKPHHSIWNIPETWFGEEEPQEIKECKEVNATATNMHSAAQIITNTMKPIGNVTANTIQNMKDLQQSTVNTVNSVVKPISQATSNAKHKIDDLQDEAAGVIEGIFDFGMAGIRKGLRLTGLQENISDLTQKSKHEIHKIQKSLDAKASDVLKTIETPLLKHESPKSEPKPHRIPKLIKLSHIASDESSLLKSDEKSSSNDSDDSIWVNPLNNNKESPSFEGHILLERTPSSPRSFANEITQKLPKEELPKVQEIPQIAMELESLHTSPDLEYEDTTDLATTTAKLRSLLQQRSSESNMTTPALSPMPQDENMKITTPLEPAEIADVDGVMPSLYKIYNKTATGLQNTFNTIKTALPGSEKTPEAPPTDSIHNWKYELIEGDENDFHARIKKLLHERRDFCTVDPAYDYLEIMDQTDGIWTKSEAAFEDELDEFDIHIPMTKTTLDILCELVAETNTPLIQEPVIKSLLLLGGKKSEELISSISERAIKNIKNLVGKLPQDISGAPLAMNLQDITEICLNAIPGYLKELIGKETIEYGIKLMVKSLQSPKINLDLTLQVFEVIATHIIQANNLMSPAYSA